MTDEFCQVLTKLYRQAQHDNGGEDSLEILFRTLEILRDKYISEQDKDDYEETIVQISPNMEELEVFFQILEIQKICFPQVKVKPSTTPSAIFIGQVLPESLDLIFSFIGLDSISTPFVEKSKGSKRILWSLETRNPAHKMKLRQAALETLLIVARSVKKSDIFPYWTLILPKSDSRPPGSRTSIADCIESHREAVLNVYAEFFKNSAGFLKLAENKSRRYASFVPVSLSLADSIVELHWQLLESLNSQFPAFLTPVLKTMQVVVENCPYHKLEDGVLTRLRLKLNDYLTKPSVNPVIQVATLSVFLSMLTEHSKHPEISKAFDDLYEVFVGLAFKTSVSSSDNNARYVAIQNLGALSSVNVSQFLRRSKDLLPVVESNFRDPDNSIVLHLLRLVKQVGKQLQDVIQEQERELALQFWLRFLTPLNIQTIDGRNCPTFRAALCDCFREIGQSFFEELPMECRFLTVTYLLNHARFPEENSVVSSALRGIGMLITYQGTCSDPGFLTDSGERLLAILNNPNIHKNVVIGATWTLANLANSIANLSEEGADPFVDLPPHLVIELIDLASRLAEDLNANMSIRANCVRSLGSFLQSLEPRNFDLEILTDILEKSVNVIILNMTKGRVMKVKWNSCYASGCVLTNEYLKTLCPRWTRDLISAAVSTFEDTSNFKVRISAAAALARIEDRSVLEFDDNLFARICLALMNALMMMDSVYDPEEAKHKADLSDQICLTLCKLVVIGDERDLKVLNTLAQKYEDYLSEAFSKASSRISPEKFSIILSAKRKIDEINNAKGPRKDYDENAFNEILSVNANVLLEFG